MCLHVCHLEISKNDGPEVFDKFSRREVLKGYELVLQDSQSLVLRRAKCMFSWVEADIFG